MPYRKVDNAVLIKPKNKKAKEEMKEGNRPGGKKKYSQKNFGPPVGS